MSWYRPDSTCTSRSRIALVCSMSTVYPCASAAARPGGRRTAPRSGSRSRGRSRRRSPTPRPGHDRPARSRHRPSPAISRLD
jgi:hypothetical protein